MGTRSFRGSTSTRRPFGRRVTLVKGGNYVEWVAVAYNTEGLVWHRYCGDIHA